MTMRSALVLVAWALCSSSIVDAGTLRATQATTQPSTIPMCVMTGRDTYQTMNIQPRDAWRYLTFYKAVRGTCRAVCGPTVCRDYPSFVATRQTCTCTGVAIRCGKHAELNITTKVCECIPGFEGDASKGCMDRNECTEAVKPCSSNQECLNSPLGSFTCAPRTCANPFGNPCGPGRACTDSPTGFTCSDIPGGVQCALGCGPNTACVANACVCNAGFARPQPFLPCVAIINSTAPAAAPTPTPQVVPCGVNAERATSASACVCKPGYQGTDPAGVGCADRNECSDAIVSPCRTNQECSNTEGSFTCLPLPCANPFGNPCGPGRACADSPTGFTCTDLFGPTVCPAGCGPNSTCRPAVSGSGPASCVCDTGFVLRNATLGCVPQV